MNTNRLTLTKPPMPPTNGNGAPTPYNTSRDTNTSR